MSLPNILNYLSPYCTPGRLIYRDQNANRPDKPYSTLAVRTTLPAGIHVREIDSEGMVTVISPVTRTIEVERYGAGAYDRLETIAATIRGPSAVDAATPFGLTISVDVVRNIPMLLNNSQYEERAILEATVMDNIITQEELGLIETVELHCQDHIHLLDVKYGG